MKRTVPEDGQRIHKVGGYSHSVWIYLAWGHQDLPARNMEAIWKSVMGTGICLDIKCFCVWYPMQTGVVGFINV